MRQMFSQLSIARASSPKMVSALLLASTAALVPMPRARLNRGPERFFGTRDDEEMMRLRRENEELRESLRQKDGGIFSGIRSLFFKKKEVSPLEKQKQEMNREIDEALKGTGLVGGLVGSLVKGTFGMLSNMMASTSADVDRVLQEAEKRLESQLGPNVKCDPPRQQSYASSNINGKVSKRVRLVTQATAASGITAMAHIDATIDGSGNVTISDLWIDDNRSGGNPPHIDSGTTPSARRSTKYGGGTIIDV